MLEPFVSRPTWGRPAGLLLPREVNINVYCQRSHQENKVADSLPYTETLCFPSSSFLFTSRHSEKEHVLGTHLM